jgi:hypothetical protein
MRLGKLPGKEMNWPLERVGSLTQQISTGKRIEG